ncbi:histidinol-phosphate transaminase [Adhaeretor mobilis]|uniref:Histidinol-phosphate aminotransferase n=1 Tax=Adhaeretor mobilis TaxID=1930276 RepID=A0A517MYY0_9BACT|nr:histidinol-phosphate transaminase [Adhaeretor mobilis]QDT00085.1 Histidinol-phosphate aminotransferase [Adhaeretor mobilis]
MQVKPNIAAMRGYVPGEQPQSGTCIKLNTNENPYPCSPKVKAAIGRVCQTGLQKYPEPTAKDFRLRAAELLSSECPNITPDWILCGNGSDDLLTIITRAFVDAGDTVRFPLPSYVLYDTLAEIQGAVCDRVAFNADWTLPLEFSSDREGLKLAFLANPNSPSGTILPPVEVLRIATALPCPLVVDEAYVDFADESCLSLPSQNENVIVTRTMSKSYSLAGLRFGYAIAQPQVIEQLAKVKDSYNCDAISIAGATAAIDDRAWFDEMRSTILATRKRMLAALRELGFECVDSQANFVWCNHPEKPPGELYEQLKAAGILVRYMKYPDWGEGIRITAGTDEQVDSLLNQLESILG